MLDEDFFSELALAPIGLLSDCQYENECRLGVCYGEDVCEYVDDKGYNCADCPKSEQIHLYYPSIDYFILLNLVLICGVPEKISMDDYIQQKQDILKDILEKCDKDINLMKKVRQFLNGIICEYKIKNR